MHIIHHLHVPTSRPTVHPQRATAASIREAAEFLARGKIVAFPTETVYGLGANALDARAVAKIFKAKGRPSDNPLIVHIATMKELHMVAKDVPAVAEKLMKRFWPGPLTFVLHKKSGVPSIVTAGGNTVAVRMPGHKVALALIKAAGCPVAAPSANLAGKPSPTTAAHVADDLGKNADMILDGGRTRHGLESTVVDLTGRRVEILRSGAVTAEMLEKVLGYRPKTVSSSNEKVRSPGMKYRHYAPSVPLFLIGSTNGKKMMLLLQKKILGFEKKKKRVGILCVKEHKSAYSSYSCVKKIVVCGSMKAPRTFAKHLYGSLRSFDKTNVDVILAENVGSRGIGTAVFDRLRRASSKVL